MCEAAVMGRTPTGPAASAELILFGFIKRLDSDRRAEEKYISEMVWH